MTDPLPPTGGGGLYIPGGGVIPPFDQSILLWQHINEQYSHITSTPLITRERQEKSDITNMAWNHGEIHRF